MSKTFILDVNRRDPRPRSPRLRSLGSGSASSGVSGAAVLGGQQPVGDGHTHANKAVLDKFSTDGQRYLCLRWLIDVYDELSGETTSQNIDERVKAGFADLANRAIDLTENSPVFGYFLSKLHADTAAGRITFEQGLIAIGTVLANAATFRGNVDLQGNLDVSGRTDYGHSLEPGTSGAGIWKDDQDNWHAQFDFLRINKKLEALEVEIQKMSHIGGALVLSATRCTITRTECPEGSNIIRCFFPATETDPTTGETIRTITNDWKPLDQARCQTFNLVTDSQTGMTTNRYWWRLVHATGTTTDGTEHYIDFDISDVSQGQPSLADTNQAAAGSCVPDVGDDVVLCGSRTRLTDGSGDYDLGRQNVIIFDAAGEGSPYIRIYNGIRTFNLGRARIDLNPQNPRLDVGELTITSSDGATKDVAEVIDESFLVWYVTINAPTDQQGNILESVTLGFSAFPDTVNEWTAQDCPAHLGDIALTADGVCYRFEASSDSYIWTRKADDFLIDALQTANRSAQTLSNMADDNVITRQEKQQLKTLRMQIDQEKEQIVAEASSLTGVSSAGYVSAYNALRAFLTYLISDSGDTQLVRTSDGYTLYAAQYAPDPTTHISAYSVDYTNLSGGQMVIAGKTYATAISDYYARLAALRRAITGGVRAEIQTSSATAYDEAVNAYVRYLQENLLDTIGTAIAGNSSISQFSSLYNAIGNWNWGTDSNGNRTIGGAGLLTTSNFASLWASHFIGDTQVASAIMGAFCDPLLDDQGNPVLDDQGNPRWVSRVGINADYFVVDTQNFKVDEDGNVKVTGEVTARRFVNEMVTIPPLYDSQSGNLVSTINLVRLLADADGNPYWYYDSSVGQRKPFLVGTARNFIIDADALQFRLTVWFPDSNQMERFCPSGTRLLFYNKSFRYGSQGQMATTSLIEFWHGEMADNFQGAIPFRGISTPYEYSGSDIVPIEAWSFDPVSSITIGNGIVEFMSMPVGDGKVEWVVTRISATYQALS